MKFFGSSVLLIFGFILVTQLESVSAELGADRLVRQKMVPKIMRVCDAAMRAWAVENPAVTAGDSLKVKTVDGFKANMVDSSQRRVIVRACMLRTLVPVIECTVSFGDRSVGEDAASSAEIEKCISVAGESIKSNVGILAGIASSSGPDELNLTIRNWHAIDRQAFERLKRSKQ